MAVTFDAVGGGNAALSGITSWSHTSTGTSRCVVVPVAVGVNGDISTTTRSVAYGGTAMTSAGIVMSGNALFGFIELFYLLGQATGAQTVAVTVTHTGTISSTIGNSVSYTGVSSVSSITTSFNSSGAPSLSVSSAAGRRVISGFCAGAAISSPTQTQRYLNNFDTGTAAGNLIIQDAAGAGTVTFGAADNGDLWGCAGLDLLPSSANTNQFFGMWF